MFSWIGSSTEDAKKFTRAVTYPVIFLFTIPISLLYPQTMCRLWGFFPIESPRENIYYADEKNLTSVE